MAQIKDVPNITMKDVATVAGVSTATVSRTLMNPEKVSLATRQKVEQAMLAVGYSPHTTFRNIKRNDSRTILAMVPDISDPFFSDIITGIEQTAAQQGYLVLIGNCFPKNQQAHTFVNLFITKQIDGLLLLGSNLPFDASKEAQRNLPPMVMVNEFAPELELPTVHIDNMTAAFDAINYLLKLGHKRIACLAGPQEMPLCHYRLQGYIQALQRNNIAVNNHYISRGPFSYEYGAHAFATLMELATPPTAIFCHSDIIAIGALSQAKKMGVRIPYDISIVGFDDIKQAQYCYPPLTTVTQPRYELGQKAMLLLIEQLQGSNMTIGSQLLNSKLAIRGSTASPKY